MERDKPQRKGTRQHRPLRLIHALLRGTTVLPHRILGRLGQGDAHVEPTTAVRQENRRLPTRFARQYVRLAFLRSGHRHTSRRGPRHRAHGHAGMDRKLPLHLRGGPRRSTPSGERHQSRRLNLPPQEGRHLPHTRLHLHTLQRRNRPRQPTIPAMGSQPPTLQRSGRPTHTPQQLGKHLLRLRREEAHRPLRRS